MQCTRVASLMDLSKITSVLCNVEGQGSWSHGLVKELSKITSVVCNVQEDKGSLFQGLVKDNKKLAASKAYSIPPPQCADQNPVTLSKIIFSALNFFMHIYNMSVTYLPSIK